MIRKVLKKFLVFFFVSSIGAVVLGKFLPIYYTPLMFIRLAEQCTDNRPMKLSHHWVPIEEISHNMPLAVMASEDNLFLQHKGFDFEQIKLAAKEAADGGRQRGASTISQQTAKNVFLWNGHSWVRKGLEVYFTVLIEVIWGKERIMEVYLNSIEMGDGIYGVEAVAQEHFSSHASQLTKRQSALIAASLPNPLKRDSGNPTTYMRKRSRQIMRLMRLIEDPKMGCEVR
ncbi:MAG: monofunctional biosynthetic peptidoglycan transglycosylase [Muribaculaceae bacterium]